MYLYIIFLSQEPSDIVLAAFAQVQSLTETLNDYINISQTQEISAVSTSLCDECHSKAKQSPRQLQNQMQQLQAAGTGTERSSNSSNSSTVITVVRNPSNASDRNDIMPDDDGYCEIDEIRLPSILKSTTSPTSISSASSSSMATTTTASVTVSSSSSSSLISTAPTSTNSINSNQTVVTPDLKRQSTISADSIPEETEHEVSGESKVQTTKTVSSQSVTGTAINDHHIGNGDSGEDEASVVASKILDENDAGDESISDVLTASLSGTNASNDADEHIEVNDAYDSISQQMSEFNLDSGSIAEQKLCCSEACGANRLIHAQSIAPAVPCHLISIYVAALNSQISQLLVSVHCLKHHF